MTQVQEPAAQQQNPPTPPAAAPNTDPPRAADPPENHVPQSRFNEVNEARKKAEAELERIQSEREAQQQEEAKKRGEWEKLANDQTLEVNRLKPQVKALTEERDRLTEALTKYVKQLRRDLPDHITALLDKLDAVDQLEWIHKNADQLQPVGHARGNGPGPRAAGPAGAEQRADALYREARERGIIPRM